MGSQINRLFVREHGKKIITASYDGAVSFLFSYIPTL